MKTVGVFVLVAIGGYAAWDRFKTPELLPLYAEPYVAVYGREYCGFTQRTINQLKLSRIPVEFMDVDDRAVADELHSRMKLSGLDTSYYLLPVVDLNNSLSVRPDDGELVEEAKLLFN